MEWFELQKCTTSQDFISRVKSKTNKGWIFRGQRIGSWLLEHKFERACQRFNIPASKKARIEWNMIREFKRRLHHYVINLPEKKAYDEWMALMQHHGAPTRLLDFTYSPYVAAYFAFEYSEPKSEVAIWAINAGWFQKQFKSISEELHTKYIAYRDDREKYGIYFKDIFMPRKPKNFILTVNPFRLNERLAYQRGVFICPGNISVPFMTNLLQYNSTELQKNIVKYIIPTGDNYENTIEALEILDSMNISRITLFPGLDGFAQSFEPRIKSLFERQYVR